MWQVISFNIEDPKYLSVSGIYNKIGERAQDKVLASIKDLQGTPGVVPEVVPDSGQDDINQFYIVLNRQGGIQCGADVALDQLLDIMKQFSLDRINLFVKRWWEIGKYFHGRTIQSSSVPSLACNHDSLVIKFAGYDREDVLLFIERYLKKYLKKDRISFMFKDCNKKQLSLFIYRGDE